jgi:hypothetical protein
MRFYRNTRNRLAPSWPAAEAPADHAGDGLVDADQ